jgi:alpha-methylacyl-CoA racemase
MNRTGPLAGYRILEMVGVGPGPFASMWFADMGAEVIRIDRPGQRDNQTRKDVLNRGRPSLALNLKARGAVDVMMRLVERADGLIEGFRPGVMERLGLGPDACMARNPKLVYGRITGWGQDGPYASEAGHDINYIALTGVLSAIGPRDGRPVPPLNLVGDFGGGGMLIIAGMLAALLERAKSGRGQVVDAAMYEGAALLTSMMWGYIAKGRWKEQRESNLFDGGPPFYGTYRCSDGGYVALGNIEAEFWSDFLERCGVDDPDLRDYQKDETRWPELRKRLDALFATRPRDEWCAMVEGSDACLSPVLDWSEAPHHPLAKARGAFTEVAGVTQPAPTPKFSRTPGSVGSPPPLVGEHTREVLARFEFSADEIERLIRNGVVDQA